MGPESRTAQYRATVGKAQHRLIDSGREREGPEAPRTLLASHPWIPTTHPHTPLGLDCHPRAITRHKLYSQHCLHSLLP